MSALRQVAQGFRNLWGAADDDYEDVSEEFDETDSTPTNRPHDNSHRDNSHRDNSHRDNSHSDNSHRENPRDRDSSRSDRNADRNAERSGERTGDVSGNPGQRYEKFTAPLASNSEASPSFGGPSGGRRLRSVGIPLRASREKNIYTLKPKSLDESSVAADYLKTGCAVVINLEEVEQTTAIRIIDFMSGVCYGLEHQGHAMKLGEKIFLFTPGDFEISSDETDYAENRDLIFKDVAPEQPASSPESAAQSAAQNNAERRSWER